MTREQKIDEAVRRTTMILALDQWDNLGGRYSKPSSPVPYLRALLAQGSVENFAKYVRDVFSGSHRYIVIT